MENLAQLQAQAAQLDAEATPQPLPDPNQEAAPLPVDPYQEAAELIDFALALFIPIYPSLEKVYTAEQKQRLAGVTVPLMDKYGVSMSGLFSKWAPEINAIIVIGPLVKQTRAAMAFDNAQRELNRGESQQEQQSGD